ncbi:hypothetical protein P280DRAFT_269104 [Massarina eburnea CBS 473.64]|uniref:Uncharacterized protein n=1 Tax=Massarina eburnea CBS 473.64 TaxID=1395130 RepID=A0A6A6S4V9_9PLEO|nr:hypothetical protein P280DRAFT_269104 [Massarina eburnea CBS 473.64]
MGRHRPSKFSFPMPGRKTHSKGDIIETKGKELTPKPSLSSMPSARDHPPRYDDSSSNISKAQRILGTGGPPFRPNSSKHANVPPSPGFMSVTISDAASDYDARTYDARTNDARTYDARTEESSLFPPRRPCQSNRASSHILPASMAYHGSERPDTGSSSVSRHLRPRASDSTMRSHYDARSSPLSISQQTSDSAVRDMALRKGKPQVVPYSDDYTHSPLAQELSQEAKQDRRRSRTPRLDLSKLFPKPRANGTQYDSTLLSPNKMVNSPSAVSSISDHFPHPMTREPTPTQRGHAKLTKPKPTPRSQSPAVHPGRSLSPSRLYRRETYDSAKVNVRRPPHGIKHWFDGLDEDSDEMDEDERVPVHAPAPVKPSAQHLAPRRKSSLGRMLEDETSRDQEPRGTQHMLDPRKNQYVYPNSPMANRHSSSQYSLQSQVSQTTTKTKDSALSKTNLQNSSVLSCSSSEDEGEDVAANRVSKRNVAVRDSIDMTEEGDIVIGQAQAFPMRSSHGRRPSASTGKFSMLSTSTNAATIEVMYTPEPYVPQHFPRFSSSNRRSSHVRQPSIIAESEDEDARPKTTANPLQSSSTRDHRSTSEPRSRIEAQKFMAVTPEEEALLEALRKKRVAMAQQNWIEGYTTAVKKEDVIRQPTPPESKQKNYRTSAFLALESPSVSPVRVVEAKKKPSKKSLAPIQTPHITTASRGRSVTSRERTVEPGMLRDSSSRGTSSDRHISITETKISHRLSPPPEFSPLDPFFPFPTPTGGIASPTTTDHPSPLPSPITPGMRSGESEVHVKVASSEPSCNSDNDDVSVLPTGVIDPPSNNVKPEKSNVSHQRRRTASSGTDAPMPMQPRFDPMPPPPKLGALPPLPNANTKNSTRELLPLSGASSRTSSVAEPFVSQPTIPRRSSRRKSSISATTSLTMGLPNSNHNSTTSVRTSSPTPPPASRNPNLYERQPSRADSRAGSRFSNRDRDSSSTGVGSTSSRCSVSDDVLAAWGSLGGNYERPNFF